MIDRRLPALLVMAACTSRSEPASRATAEPPATSAAAPATSAAAPPSPGGDPGRFVEARLAVRSARGDADDRALVWSPTGRAVAWVEPVGDRERVVVTGIAQRVFDHVRELELADDGVTPRYIANEGGALEAGSRVENLRGGVFRLVVGDRLGPPADAAIIVRDLDEPDAPFAMIGWHGVTESLTVAGHEGPAVASIALEHLTWLPDGRPTYPARIGGAEHVVIGVDLGPAYTRTTRPRVSQSGAVAYGGRDADGGWHVMVDRAPGPRYDDVDELAISPDGVPAYQATRGRATYAVQGDRELGPYDRAMDFAFSGSGGHVAFTARRGDRWFVVADGKPGPGFPGVGGAASFSDDGGHVAYVAHLRDEGLGPVAVVRDGRLERARGGEARTLRWSRDGRHLAYVAGRGGDQLVVVDGVPGPAMIEVGALVFDGLGQVVYEARRRDHERRTVACVVRGTTPRCYDDVGEPNLIAGDPDLNFTLDPSGRHLAFRAQRAGRWFVVIDDVEGPPVDRTWPPRWSRDGAQLGYGAQLGDELWWKVVPVPGA